MYAFRWRLVGLTGAAGCGKDTAASLLQKRVECVRMAFADPLRQMVEPILGPCNWEDRKWKEKINPDLGVSPRHILQSLGTEWGRELIDPNLWVKLTARRVSALPEGVQVLITDVRFPNEFQWIRQLGGGVVRIIRDGCYTVRPHASETSSKGLSADITLNNNGTLEELDRTLMTALLLRKHTRVIA